jgi:hypothetical protein
MYMCSMISGQCPNNHIPGFSFSTHAECVDMDIEWPMAPLNHLKKQRNLTKNSSKTTELLLNLNVDL